MKINKKIFSCQGIKLCMENNGQEVARAFLFIIKNQFRARDYGLVEDVFVEKSQRGQGLGSKLIKELIKIARKNKCYKIIATSRHGRENVHRLYEKLGFKNFGIEFKMYLDK